MYSRTTGVETWITTDGRAYFVTLHEHTGSAGVEAEDGSTQVGGFHFHTHTITSDVETFSRMEYSLVAFTCANTDLYHGTTESLSAPSFQPPSFPHD